MMIAIIVTEGGYVLITGVLMVCVLIGIFIYIYDVLSRDLDGEIDVDDDNWDDIVDYLDMVTPEEEDDEEDT